MKTIAVFASASDRVSKKKKKQAYNIGRILGKADWKLIYGAGECGLMKQIVDGYLSTSPPCKPFGSTTKYISEIEKSAGQGKIHQVTCRSMSERKQLYMLADVVLVIPGGNGTTDELFEFLTYKQLALEAKKRGEEAQTWNGNILLLRAGVWESYVHLWENMYKQKMAPDWRNMVEIVEVGDLRYCLTDYIAKRKSMLLPNDRTGEVVYGGPYKAVPSRYVWNPVLCSEICVKCESVAEHVPGVGWYCTNEECFGNL